MTFYVLCIELQHIVPFQMNIYLNKTCTHLCLKLYKIFIPSKGLKKIWHGSMVATKSLECYVVSSKLAYVCCNQATTRLFFLITQLYLSGVWLYVDLRTYAKNVVQKDWTTCLRFVYHSRLNCHHSGCSFSFLSFCLGGGEDWPMWPVNELENLHLPPTLIKSNIFS